MNRATYLTVDEMRLLDHWCRNLRDTFPCIGVYLVGSVLVRPDYRDVDVRVVMVDKAHRRLTRSIDLLDLGMLLSRWGQEQTGLPIDAQVQSLTESSQFTSQRNARGIRYKPSWIGEDR